MILSGWGRATSSRSTLIDADQFAQFSGPGGMIAHGAGRSYGDCAINTDGAVLLTGARNKILSWDEGTDIVDVEPGVTFAQLLAEFLPRNLMVPVTPGTGFATIGGAVAHDVHGKNHESAGSFGQHVTALDLLTPDGTLHHIGPNTDPDLFAATVGGIGLTGLITKIAFRMQRVPGPSMQVRSQPFADLETLLAAMEAAASATYSVAWIDGTTKGRILGRGILETAEPGAAADHARPPGRRLTIPFDFPSATLNPLTVRLFNEAYFHRLPKSGRDTIMHSARFLYPLDALLHWNRIYGNRGFHQFQCVLPFTEAAKALRSLLTMIAESGQASFLSVLKRLGPGRAGHLSFPQPGLTLALDFPIRESTAALYRQLTDIVLHHAGRLYLAKDALMTATDFRTMYPEWRAFEATLQRVDPERRLQSDMRRRLQL